MALRLCNLWVYPEYSHEHYLFGTHLRVDSLFYGVLLSYLWHFHRLESRIMRVPSWALYTSGAILLSPAFIFTLESNKWLSVVGVVLFYVAAGNILIAAMRVRESSLGSMHLLQTLGAASYSIYLWHMPVNYWGYPSVQMLTGANSYAVYFVTYIAGSFAFGWMMNRLIEAPVLLLRDRYYPTRLLNQPTVFPAKCPTI
jgi:peptidoglycan/LPS O-acetylase OafA/YrhL